MQKVTLSQLATTNYESESGSEMGSPLPVGHNRSFVDLTETNDDPSPPPIPSSSSSSSAAKATHNPSDPPNFSFQVPSGLQPNQTKQGRPIKRSRLELESSSKASTTASSSQAPPPSVHPQPSNQAPQPAEPSTKRLKIAAAAVRYYETVVRECTAGNMHFQHVLKNFGEQWGI